MGLGGLEPPTSRLSGVRSNQLSYRPTPLKVAEEIEPRRERLWTCSLPSASAIGKKRRTQALEGTNRARPADRPSSFPAPSSRKREE